MEDTTPKTNIGIRSPKVRQALASATLAARDFAREIETNNQYDRRRGNDGFILGAILQAFDYEMRKGGAQ